MIFFVSFVFHSLFLSCLVPLEWLLRDLMVASACQDDQDLLFAPATVHAKIKEQAKTLKPLNWAYAITIVEELARAIRFSEQPRTLIDSAVVTLVNLSELVDIDQSAAEPSIQPGGDSVKKKSPSHG